MVDFRAISRLVVMVAMLVTALGGNQALAQTTVDDEGVFVSEVTGLEITYTDDWELLGSEVYPGDAEEELIQLESEFGPLMILFGIYDDPADSRDDLIHEIQADAATVEVLEEDADADVAWAFLGGEQADGTPSSAYIEVQNGFVGDHQLIAMTAVNSDDMLDQFELIQDTIEVDGDSVFNEVDADDIEELMDNGDTSRTPRDDEGTPDSEGNTSETGGVTPDDGEESDEGTYQFESEAVEVVVSDPISIDEVQLEEESYEQILLVGSGAIGAVSVIVNDVDAASTLDGFMSGFVAEMDDSEEIDSGETGGIAWSLYQVSIGGTDMYVYATVEPRFDEMHYLELIAAPADDFEDQFLTFQESVEIDGDQMFPETEVEDVLDIAEGL